MGKLKKSLLPYWGWAAAIGLLVYLVTKHPHFLKSEITLLSLDKILAVAGFTILANACQGLRFYFLWSEGNLPIWRFFFLPFCMHSGNIVLPLRGGETFQPLFIAKWDKSQKLARLFMWVVADKISEFLTLLPFVALAAWYFDYSFYGALAIWAGAWALAAFAYSRTKTKARNPYLAFGFAMLSWIFNFSVFYSLVSSVKAAAGLLVGTSVGSAIPGFPAAIGTFEYAFVKVCQMIGIQELGFRAEHDALVVGIGAHSVSIIVTLAIGIPLAAAWGWPSEKERVDAQPQSTPLKYRISNVVVYCCGVVTVLLSGALWTKQIKIKNRFAPKLKTAGEPS